MIYRLFKFYLPLLLLLFSFGVAMGQEEKENSKGELPEGIKENLAKRRIKQEEEDFQELIKRGEEALKLTEELNKSFEENNKLSSEDTKKLEKLEKVVKKIRRDLGAADEEDNKDEDNPTNLPNTLSKIKEKTSNLVAELKKTGRFAISVVAVESSNIIFRLVKFLRFEKK